MKIKAKSIQNLQVEIQAGNHTFLADEPLGVGDDAGPDPYGLLLGALAACKVMTLFMYARRKKWPLEQVEIELDIRKIHARDCEGCDGDPNARVDLIETDLVFTGDLTPEQVARLAEISERCPVHRTLTGNIQIQTQAALAG
jgi:putative redox protein